MKKTGRDSLKDPHIVWWGILIVLIASAIIFFNYIKPYFIRIALIGILSMVFYWLDDMLFRRIGKKMRKHLAGNSCDRGWKAFPVFLFEIYIIYFLSSYLEILLGDYISPESIRWWHIWAWIGLMYSLYLLKEFGER